LLNDTIKLTVISCNDNIQIVGRIVNSKLRGGKLGVKIIA